LGLAPRKTNQHSPQRSSWRFTGARRPYPPGRGPGTPGQGGRYSPFWAQACCGVSEGVSRHWSVPTWNQEPSFSRLQTVTTSSSAEKRLTCQANTTRSGRPWRNCARRRAELFASCGAIQRPNVDIGFLHGVCSGTSEWACWYGACALGGSPARFLMGAWSRGGGMVISYIRSARRDTILDVLRMHHRRWRVKPLPCDGSPDG
jgi:hypothetical protein